MFGLVWNAPTGSAEMCLGDHALFLGVPGVIGAWGSAWVADAWADDPNLTQPAVLQSSMSAAGNTFPATGHWLIRTDSDVAEVIVASSSGAELDRTPVSNGLSMVIVGPQALAEDETVNDLSVIVVGNDGKQSTLTSLAPPDNSTPPECAPGDPPRRPLPTAGVQPQNPAAAAAQIRERHALLVDRSVPADQKPADLLDDDTGVQTAIALMDAGPYSDVAASATYAIDELVFTAPDEAYFLYTITTSASTWTDRFGHAKFNGKVWQITRSTVCQDLALAQSACAPTAPPVEPPDPEWEAAWQEWVSRAMLYGDNDGCPPMSQC